MMSIQKLIQLQRYVIFSFINGLILFTIERKQQLCLTMKAKLNLLPFCFSISSFASLTRLLIIN